MNILFKKIAVASDHAGFPVKEKIKEYLLEHNIQVKDFGTYSQDSCDYSDYAHPLATAVENKEFEIGITVCGSGNGINMTVNKHEGIRGALCWTSEISRLSREHNDANVCSLPGRYLLVNEAIDIVKEFITTPFEGGRHQLRINKIPLAK